MKLSDKIARAIPPGNTGVTIAQAVALCGGQQAHVEKAFEAIAVSGAAIMVKRGRGGVLYLVHPASGVLACKVCRREFARKAKSKRVTCSSHCHAASTWGTVEQRAARGRAISKALSTPEGKARLAEHNKKRWSKPGEREKLAAQNRREWAKPEKAAIRAAKIRINHGKPEVRKFYSDLRKKDWANPVQRKKMRDAAAASQKVAAYRAHFSEVMKQRWKDGDLRKKYTEANKARNTPELRAASSKRMKERHAKRRAEVLA